MDWYAARVMSGKEYEVKKKIEMLSKDFEIFIPRRPVKEVKEGKIEVKTEKMMPGYLLIGSKSPVNTPITEEFLKIIGRVTQEEIDRLKAQEMEKNDPLELGSKVIVVEGPMAGCKGHIVKDNDNGTVKCKIVFQGMQLEVDLRMDFLSTSK